MVALGQVLELQETDLGQLASVLTGESSLEVPLHHALRLREVLLASRSTESGRLNQQTHELLAQAGRIFSGAT